MTRTEALAQYRPVRAAIQRVLKHAIGACAKADFTRAAKHIGLWSEGEILVVEGSGTDAMLADVALFEPNQRGRRAYACFLSSPQAAQLDPQSQQLARRMDDACFSIFQEAGKHPAAGRWFHDRLNEDRLVWVMDEGLEASAEPGMALAMRLFDAGPFYAGFGIVTQPDEDAVRACISLKRSENRLPVRHSLAATCYGDQLKLLLPPFPGTLKAMLFFLENLATDSPPKPAKSPSRERQGRQRLG